MSALERRCRRLLRAYPAWYRRDREEEMLGTLLEASPAGRRWPSARDARAVIAGGLRVRAGLGQRQSAAGHVRLMVMLAITLPLILESAHGIGRVAYMTVTVTGRHDSGVVPALAYAAAYYLLLLPAVGTAWLGPRVVLTVAVVAAVVLALADAGRDLAWQPAAEVLDAALLVGLIVLVRGGQRLPKSWLWLAGAEFAFAALLTYARFALVPPGAPPPFAMDVLWWAILFGIVALWMPIDARPALALAISVVYSNLAADLSAGRWLNVWAWYTPVAAAVILAAAASRSIRRQTAL
jgi:hypothetical protein